MQLSIHATPSFYYVVGLVLCITVHISPPGPPCSNSNFPAEKFFSHVVGIIFFHMYGLFLF